MRKPKLRSFIAVALFTALLRAPSSAAERPRVEFVRGGALVGGNEDVSILHGTSEVAFDAVRFSDQRRLLTFDWQPETNYEFQLGGEELIRRSPRLPAPYRVHKLKLESLATVDDTGGGIDTAVRFSPNGQLLAIGSFGGWLRIYETLSGRLLHRQRVHEGIVKQLVFAPDGDTLYVGEQSPDGRVLALGLEYAATATEPLQLTQRWSRRLADDLETSRAIPGDRFSLYWLPAASHMKCGRDGRLFVAGRHSWPVGDKMANRSRIYCLDPDGNLLWQFPPNVPAQLTIPHLAIDPEGRRLLVHPSRTQADDVPLPIKPGSLALLNAQSGELLATTNIGPLLPHFARAESWDSMALSEDCRRAVVGLADGRVLRFALNDDQFERQGQLELGTPIVLGRVPIAASAGFSRIAGDRLFLQTQYTHVPFGNPLAAERPPSTHPGANTLSVADLDGRILWRYRGPFALSGIWHAGIGDASHPRWVVVACRQRLDARQGTPLGFLLFDLARGGGGSDKLVYYYPTEGPVAFQADISSDGRFIAVVETPARTPDGQHVYGSYQVHVVH